MVISNVEWSRFRADIGDDWHINNDDMLEIAEAVDVTVGMLCFQGSRIPDTHQFFTATELDDQYADLLTVFRRWQRKQKTATLVIEGDREKIKAVKAAVKKLGWKVICETQPMLSVE